AGTDALPETCAGHVGYAVVPWRQGEGHATEALRALMPVARKVGLGQLALSTDETNLASLRVIAKAGGVFCGRARRHGSHGGGEEMRFTLPLTPAP
ncbi:MAG: GNAT family N-acetyltransferase, partial [Pseudomonadota bacterium]